MSLCHYVTVSLCHCVIVLLCHCVTVSGVYSKDTVLDSESDIVWAWHTAVVEFGVVYRVLDRVRPFHSVRHVFLIGEVPFVELLELGPLTCDVRPPPRALNFRQMNDGPAGLRHRLGGVYSERCLGF